MRKTAPLTHILDVSSTEWSNMEPGPSWLEAVN